MDKNKSYIKYCLFLLILLCILLFPINYPIMLNYFRIVDLILLISFFFFLFINPKINLNLLITFIVICLIFIISCLIGFFYNSLELKKVVFLLKYFYIFYIPWLTVSIIDNERKKRIVSKLLFFSYLAICCWVIYYQYFEIYGSYRASYPFSLDYSTSDAHTLSSYMGMFFAFYIFYFKDYFNIKKFISAILIFLFIISTLLTGSRTGLILILLTFFLNIFLNKIKLKYYIYGCFFAFIFYWYAIYFSESRSILRALSISFADESAKNRLIDLGRGLSDSSLSYYFFGLGIFNTKVWFDGLISILISHGGLSFVFMIFVYYLFIISKALKNKNDNKKIKLIFIFSIILYLISNLITESIFILRNAFPVLLIISIFYNNCIKEDYKIKKN